MAVCRSTVKCLQRKSPEYSWRNLKVFPTTHRGFSIAHSLSPTFRPVCVCISLNVRLPSSANFQKMLETSISKRCSFSFLKYEDRLLHVLILSIDLICWLQRKVTCIFWRVQFVLMYCHTICHFHFHCYQFAEYWNVTVCRIWANKLFMYFSIELDSALLCILLHHQLSGTLNTVFITTCSFQ